MPSRKSVYNLIERKISDAGIARDSYTLADEYRDDRFCVYDDDNGWYFGWNERGQRNELARFVGDLECAEYLVFILLKDRDDVNFPTIDWTEYASLP